MGIVHPRPAMRRGESRRIHYQLREFTRLYVWATICGIPSKEAAAKADQFVRSLSTNWIVVERETEQQAAPTKGSYGHIGLALRALVALERSYGKSGFEVRVVPHD